MHHKFNHDPTVAARWDSEAWPRTYDRSECVTDHVDAYLLTGSLPPKGTVCPANPNPFLPAAARTLQRTAPLVGLPPPALLHR
ncbi:alpha/beta hydrolase [Kribbella capetownensis]|uniref:alpha/beta hydrolase n=1 Tax=Kribbella capetownensis TaxID=1572659 RepID=UPI003B510145